MAKVIGIDWGTTTSCMAVVEGGDPGVLEKWRQRGRGGEEVISRQRVLRALIRTKKQQTTPHQIWH